MGAGTVASKVACASGRASASALGPRRPAGKALSTYLLVCFIFPALPQPPPFLLLPPTQRMLKLLAPRPTVPTPPLRLLPCLSLRSELSASPLPAPLVQRSIGCLAACAAAARHSMGLACLLTSGSAASSPAPMLLSPFLRAARPCCMLGHCRPASCGLSLLLEPRRCSTPSPFSKLPDFNTAFLSLLAVSSGAALCTHAAKHPLPRQHERTDRKSVV